MIVNIYSETSNELPSYSTDGSAGMDVRSAINIVVPAHNRVLIPTDLYVGLPEGYEMQVRPRSGLALKHGITVLNTPGTVDANYRGNIGVILMNHSNEDFKVEIGDRIAQIIVAKYETVEWNEVHNKEMLGITNRGASGFGDSGIK